MPEDSIPLKAMVDNQDCHAIAHAYVAAKERRLRAEVGRIKEALRRGNVSELVSKPHEHSRFNRATENLSDR